MPKKLEKMTIDPEVAQAAREDAGITLEEQFARSRPLRFAPLTEKEIVADCVGHVSRHVRTEMKRLCPANERVLVSKLRGMVERLEAQIQASDTFTNVRAAK